jgi:hypothetical protein
MNCNGCPALREVERLRIDAYGILKMSFACRHIRNKLFASCQGKEMVEDSWTAVATITGAVDLLQLPLSPDFKSAITRPGKILTALIV